jgi:hypothetical protein
VNDKRTGRGTYYFANGDKYEGYFNNGKRDGVGFSFEGDRVFHEEYNDGTRILKHEIPGGASCRVVSFSIPIYLIFSDSPSRRQEDVRGRPESGDCVQ